MKIALLILGIIALAIYMIIKEGKRKADLHPLNIKVEEHDPENIAFEEALKRCKIRKEIEEI